MTDEEYMFHSEVKEKKRIARGVHNTNRTGKGRVRMPSDYLTNKEKEALSGECIIYDLNKPIMSLNEFSKMPKDIQQEYLTHLSTEFHPTMHDLSTMFGCTDSNIRSYFKRNDLIFKSNRGWHLNNKWNEFIGQEVINKRTENLYFSSGSFTIIGTINNVVKFIETFCKDDEFKFTISFERKENK